VEEMSRIPAGWKDFTPFGLGFRGITGIPHVRSG
jgi:hypothetical protein